MILRTDTDAFTHYRQLCSGKPVLTDFMWAVSDERPYFTPDDLGRPGRPPDGSFCDVYSMGKVFEQVNGHRHAAFDPVIDLMTDPDASLRVVNLDVLRILFACAVEDSADEKEAAL